MCDLKHYMLLAGDRTRSIKLQSAETVREANKDALKALCDSSYLNVYK